MILFFALTERELLHGIKTVTRRKWSPRTFAMWQRAWDEGRHVHAAWSRTPCYGGRPIGRFQLTARPHLERLAEMPAADLAAEGGMCATIEEFAAFARLKLGAEVAVVRFKKLNQEGGRAVNGVS